MNTGNQGGRRHLLTILGALSLFPLLKFRIQRSRRTTVSCGPPAAATTTTLKVLGQDGRLLEVDASRVRTLKKKVSNEELKDWIKRPS